ncbi:hypothetical protein D3C77_596570 [compost metagenome]
MHAQYGAARQTDDRIAPPLFPALHRLEQVGIGRIGELEVQRQRRIEIGQRLERQRNAVVAFGGQAQEFFAGHISLVVEGRTERFANAPARSRSGLIRRASANGPGP